MPEPETMPDDVPKLILPEMVESVEIGCEQYEKRPFMVDFNWEIMDNFPRPRPTIPELFSSNIPPLLCPQPNTNLGNLTGFPAVEATVSVSAARFPPMKEPSA